VKICRVLGNVVATAKHPAFCGQRLLIVEPVDERGRAVGTSYLAVDQAQAGPGDVVLVMSEGSGVRQILDIGTQVPIRSLIVGIVDRIDSESDSEHEKTA
jgi:ethanolamine utilization protein EutN